MAFLPSEIHRLVLGFLTDQACSNAANQFLAESHRLDEVAELLRRGRNVSLRVAGRSLLDILDDFGQIHESIEAIFDLIKNAEDNGDARAASVSGTHRTDGSVRKMTAILGFVQSILQAPAPVQGQVRRSNPAPQRVDASAQASTSNQDAHPDVIPSNDVQTVEDETSIGAESDIVTPTATAPLPSQSPPRRNAAATNRKRPHMKLSQSRARTRSLMNKKRREMAAREEEATQQNMAARISEELRNTSPSKTTSAVVTTEPQEPVPSTSGTSASIQDPQITANIISSTTQSPLKSRKNALKARVPVKKHTSDSSNEDRTTWLAEQMAREVNTVHDADRAVSNLFEKPSFMKDLYELVDSLEMFIPELGERQSNGQPEQRTADAKTPPPMQLENELPLLQPLITTPARDTETGEAMCFKTPEAANRLSSPVAGQIVYGDAEAPNVNQNLLSAFGDVASQAVSHLEAIANDITTDIQTAQDKPETQESEQAQEPSCNSVPMDHPGPATPKRLSDNVADLSVEASPALVIAASSPDSVAKPTALQPLSSTPVGTSASLAKPARRRRRSPDFAHVIEARKMLDMSKGQRDTPKPKLVTSQVLTRRKSKRHAEQCVSNFIVSMAAAITNENSRDIFTHDDINISQVEGPNAFVRVASARLMNRQCQNLSFVFIDETGAEVPITHYVEGNKLVLQHNGDGQVLANLSHDMLVPEQSQQDEAAPAEVVVELTPEQKEKMLISPAKSGKFILDNFSPAKLSPEKQRESPPSPKRPHLLCAVTPTKDNSPMKITARFSPSRSLPPSLTTPSKGLVTPQKATYPLLLSGSKASGAGVLSTPVLADGDQLDQTPSKGLDKAYFTPKTPKSGGKELDTTPGLRFLIQEGELLSTSGSEDSLSPSQFRKRLEGQKHKERMRERKKSGAQARKNLGLAIEADLNGEIQARKASSVSSPVAGPSSSSLNSPLKQISGKYLPKTPSKLTLASSPIKPIKMLSPIPPTPPRPSGRTRSSPQRSAKRKKDEGSPAAPGGRSPKKARMSSPKDSVASPGKVTEVKPKARKRAVLIRVDERSPLKNAEQSNWEAKHDVNNLDNYSKHSKASDEKAEAAKTSKTRRRHISVDSSKHIKRALTSPLKKTPLSTRASSLPPSSPRLAKTKAATASSSAVSSDPDSSAQPEGESHLQSFCSALGLIQKKSESVMPKPAASSTKDEAANNTSKLRFEKTSNGCLWSNDSNKKQIRLVTGRSGQTLSLPPNPKGSRNPRKFDLIIQKKKQRHERK